MIQPLRFFAVASLVLLLTSCAGWEPSQTESVLKAVETIERSGGISKTQADGLREAIGHLSEGIRWLDVLEWFGAVLLAMLGSVAGVQKLRGPAKPLAREDAAVLKMLVEAAKKS